MTTPTDRLLSFTSTDYGAPDGDGRPWGDGTEMARRAHPAVRLDPWDSGCGVSTYLGGKAAMDDYRDTLEAVIAAAEASTTPAYANGHWQRGHVYIVDWRFNCLRDLSTNTEPWGAMAEPADDDATAVGLVRRLMQTGVQVRLMLWYPLQVSSRVGFAAHIEDHQFAATLVQAENARLMTEVFQVPSDADPLGVVALDMRVADGQHTGSLHQKMMLVRTPALNVAFAGGVDLAYTRRDALLTHGDWQSGDQLPLPGPYWPRPVGDPDRYRTAIAARPWPTSQQGSDLPATDAGGVTLFGTRQSWHDQHLKLTGPIVATLEWQFTERWRDDSRVWTTSPWGSVHQVSQQVLFSTDGALQGGGVRPLPAVTPVDPAGSSTVQMWRTIPWRDTRTTGPFLRAEFTVLAGISKAVSSARELIWIFDQYFWSRSLAVQIHQQLLLRPALRVIIVLPPHADDLSNAPDQHRARAEAVGLLMKASGIDVSGQVGIYSMWDPHPPEADPGHKFGRGVYVHAKVQMYDNALLVCGSANLNRRSLLCDAELALAVADPAVVTAHQQKLWNYLFPAGNAPWPNLDLNLGGNGSQFFDAFTAAVGNLAKGIAGNSRLIIDPWDREGPALPGNAVRERAKLGFAFNQKYEILLDPSSLDKSCEKHSPVPSVNLSEWASLDQVSALLETKFHASADGKKVDWPYRKQA